MRICPNCHKEHSDEQVFCGECATKLETVAPSEEVKSETTEAAVIETVEETSKKESVFVGLLAQAKALAEKVKAFALKTKDVLLAMPKKKQLTVGGIAAGVLVVLIVLIALLAGGSKPQYQLFLKDNQIYYMDLSSGETLELTKNLTGNKEITSSQLVDSAYQLGDYVFINEKGTRIFYPDRIDNGITLYTRSLKNLKEEAVKLDSGVAQYFINDKGTQVVYLKSDGENGTLYLHDLKEKTKLASDVTNFRVDEECKKILYMNREKNVYVLTLGKDEALKVAGNINSMKYASEDLTTLFYTKEGALYIQKVGEEDRIKVDDEPYSIAMAYDSGKAYYIKKTESEEPLMNYVEDDLAASDAAMVQPELVYPDRPTAPQYPYRSDYDTTEAYDEAKAKYDTDYEAYQEALEKYNTDCENVREQYYKDRDLYYEKQNRDSMREYLKENTFEVTKYSLYFFDGKESKLLAEEMNGAYNYDACRDTEMLVVETVEAVTLSKVKLSELEYASEVYTKLNETLDNRTQEYHLAVGAEMNLLETASEHLIFAPDGSAIYYLDDVVVDEETDNSTGDLYEIVIKKGKPEAAKLYDENVSTSRYKFIEEDLCYFKNLNSDNSGDLYINGEEVDYDVYAYDILKTDIGLLYFTDWDEEHESGTLKLYKKGEKSKVADDVHDFIIVGGKLLYLYDYSTTYYTGTLYCYNNGKPEKLDEDVMALMFCTQK